jgi:hypothetical protein
MLALLLLLFQTPALTDDKEVLAMVDAARALAPEFAADIHLQLAASSLIQKPQGKRQLIEEAFEAAAHAELEYPRFVTNASTDSLAYVKYRETDLDALTLRTRAITAMLAIDAARARALFERLLMPEVPSTPCEVRATPDFRPYYTTAAAVFTRTFDTRERSRGNHLQFLRTVVAGVRSPVQLVGVLDMLATIDTEGTRDEHLMALAGILDRLTASDRDAGIHALSLFQRTAGWSAEFARALRSWFVRQVRGERCADSVRLHRFEMAVAFFNSHYSKELGPAFEPIIREELQSGKIVGSYKDDEFWRSPRSKQVLAGLQWLNHGNRKLPDKERFWTEAERATPEWNARHLELLKLIENWSESEEGSPVGYMFMVSQTYSLLARLVPSMEARDRNFSAWLAFLESQYPSTASRNAWFAQVKRMLAEKQFLAGLASSRNPVIATYAALHLKLR